MNVNKKISSLEEISKVQLSKIFSANPNKKHLVLEPSVIKPLERVCGVKWLKGNGVDKIFKLEHHPANFNADAVFFIIYFNNDVFELILQHIKSYTDNVPENKFHIIVVPRVSFVFEEELEKCGLYSIVHLYSFQWMPIHVDTGILSLEIPRIFENIFVHHNLEPLQALSKILWQLFLVTGKPLFILGIGELSSFLLSQYESLCEDIGDTDKFDSDFGGLIVMDRNVDYVSTLLTPGTYSGLLNEVYGVIVGNCEYKDEVERKTDEKCNLINNKQPVNFNLESTHDTVYLDIRYRYFTEVTAVLGDLTKQLKNEKIKSDGSSVAEMKHYVQTQLKTIQQKKKYITNHLMAAETIINTIGRRYEQQKVVEQDIIQNKNKRDNLSFLEETLSTLNDICVSLRLFCLLLITQKLSDSEIESFWIKFLHQFGFQNGIAFNNLINIGLLEECSLSSTSNLQSLPSSIMKIPRFASSNSYTNANRLKQIPSDPDKINLKHPTCASYVFGGSYIPLVTQIANLLLNSTPLTDVKTKLESFGPLVIKGDSNYPLVNRTLLIYVIGGVTYAEIAACHLLENITGSRIFIFSDKIISGNDIVKGIVSSPR